MEPSSLRFVLALAALASAAPSQFTAAPLQLAAPSPGDVTADLVVFDLTVLAPDGVWLDLDPATPWPFFDAARWVSAAADQQPLQARFWAQPFVGGANPHVHFPPGAWTIACAGDAFTGYPVGANAVHPTPTPTVFASAAVELVCRGYAVVPGPGANAALDRPPFANLTALAPADIVGALPVTVLTTPLVPFLDINPSGDLDWIAGAHSDTCSGVARQPTLPFPTTVGFFGLCSAYNVRALAGAGSLSAGPITIEMQADQLTIGPGNPLPAPIAGTLGVTLRRWGEPAPLAIELDLDAAMPGLFPRGGFARQVPDVWLLPALQPFGRLVASAPVPAHPAFIGAELHLQGYAFAGDGTIDVTDVFGLYLSY